MRAHKIVNGVVANTCLVNEITDGWIDADIHRGGIGWTWDNNTLSPPQPPVVPIMEAKAAKLAELAALRYSKETAGITLNGMSIKTDRESQAMLSGAKAYTDVNPTAMIDWKCGNGWMQIDAATIAAVSSAVGSHVQLCFSAEMAHALVIETLTTTADVDGYDMSTGWPV